MDISSPWRFFYRTFWRKDFLTPWTCRHWDISALRYFITVAQLPKVWKRPYCFARCQNIYVPKCLCAEISHAKTSMPPKISSAKMSQCRKFLVLKCPWIQNVHVPVRPPGRNMHVQKCPCDEMSILNCLMPKCQVRKWWEAVLMAPFTLRYHLTGQFL